MRTSLAPSSVRKRVPARDFGKGKIVYENEFKTLCEQIGGQNLDCFFSQWLHTNMKLDYRVVDVAGTDVSGKHHIRVRVKRFGDARMPVPVKVIFQDNQEETKTVEKNLDESELNFYGQFTCERGDVGSLRSITANK